VSLPRFLGLGAAHKSVPFHLLMYLIKKRDLISNNYQKLLLKYARRVCYVVYSHNKNMHFLIRILRSSLAGKMRISLGYIRSCLVWLYIRLVRYPLGLVRLG